MIHGRSRRTRSTMRSSAPRLNRERVTPKKHPKPGRSISRRRRKVSTARP
ncbi:MAG: hypothetical protein L6R43_06010 [Planctomycetes bacterium]|nr:hypothetical protein [Planctomycetota bacterium]